MIGLLITQCLLIDITHCRTIKEPMLEATTIERTWECVSMDYNPKKEKNL